MKIGFSTFLAAVLIFLGAGCGQQGYHLQARFSNLQQLKPGDPVLMAGIEVGRVEEIAVDPDGAPSTVTMRIKRSTVVKTDSIAKIGPTVPAGRSLVALEGGLPNAPAAVDGAILSSAEPGE